MARTFRPYEPDQLAHLTAMSRRRLEEIVVSTRTLRTERSRKGGSA